MQRGRETPIEGGAINMDRVQLMYDQVQTFQLLRHEMRGYVFLERQKREEEDKEFLRRLIREYQADLRATTNAGRIPCRCLARPRQPSPIASATIRCGASPASPTTTMRGRGGGEEADGQQPQP
ncbi:uncharacterized protein ACA1_099230 [Acanthamoeba castellanii str. Neff]|uniref:Uncharacterized protein n=1 Tax=Acanthamoeba castellanii (strain ATCC 30010 / Neff) TaxID=1257118 RepID=L8H5T9_ACACF|nr:uncharacterized protein ACA1_099230 [Acanthamoeba castellanii str. Neff]ELR20525.1 hypothetical protein ACA1_099230 [Acanthamoeba castellanii str. Neff]